MVKPEPASIVIIDFPFSDLSGSKQRPALVLADAERDDWILCQITSVSSGEPSALPVVAADLSRGAMHNQSYVRPLKLFTAHVSLIRKRVAILKPDAFARILAYLTQRLGT